MPRGLNQLGNTCYLNSLLQACFISCFRGVPADTVGSSQYLYTIKDLREAITPFADSGDEKVLDDSKLTDDDLKRHRVGGRLVTRREIARSKKCA